MSKSVIIIGPAHPLRGGLASFNERLAREFVMQNYDTSIYTFSLQYPSFLFPGTTQFSEEPAPKDLSVFVKINSINPLNWIKVGLEIKNKKPDIVIVRYWLPFMGPCLGTILRLIKRNKCTKIICIADNIIPHEKRIGDKQFTQYFVKPIDGFITMSSKVLNDLKLFSSKKALEIAHPLYDNFGEKINKEDAFTHLNLDSTKKTVLFFGFIRKYKGLDLLFEAISILKHKKYFEKVNIQFLIAGEFYEDPTYYLELLNKLSIQEYVVLKTNFIQDSEVKYYLSIADCVIQPYKNATQSGVTPLAYHFEVPMIVTNVGGLPKLVPETIGSIAEPTSDSIAEKIEEFFSKSSDSYIENIKIEKKKYTWNKLVESIVSM